MGTSANMKEELLAELKMTYEELDRAYEAYTLAKHRTYAIEAELDSFEDGKCD